MTQSAMTDDSIGDEVISITLSILEEAPQFGPYKNEQCVSMYYNVILSEFLESSGMKLISFFIIFNALSFHLFDKKIYAEYRKNPRIEPNYYLRFCDEGLKLLCETCDLKQLDLSETRVTDESVHQLLEMESLQVHMSHKL